MKKHTPGHENNPPRVRTKRPAIKAVPTIWEIPDDMWLEVEPIIPVPQKRSPVGRKRVPYRKELNGILCVLRTGCQWKAVAKEYGSGSTCHLRFQEWVRAGVFRRLWAILLDEYDDLSGESESPSDKGINDYQQLRKKRAGRDLGRSATGHKVFAMS